MEKHVNGLEWRDVNRLAALPVIEIGPSFISKIVKVVHHWRWGLLMELRGGEGIGVECVCGFSQWRGPLYRSLSEQINSDAYDQVSGGRERVCERIGGRGHCRERIDGRGHCRMGQRGWSREDGEGRSRVR